MSKEWSIFVVKEKKEIDPSKMFDRLNEKTKKEEIELITFEDADKHTKEDCELVMRRKNPE